jgi:hypothetical protein
MAIDSDVSIANLVTEALKRAGRTSPTAGQISDATSYGFREVKADLAMRGGRHPVLVTDSITVTTDGLQRYTWPTAARELMSVQLLDGPDEWRGTAQSATSTTLVLDAALSIGDANDVKGKYLCTTGGTGANQIRQITAWNNTTKTATVPTWTTTPDNTTTYLIATDHRLLWHIDKASKWNTIPNPGLRGRSYSAATFGRELYLEHSADKVYVLWWNYWSHLDRMDNAGTVVLGHIREYLSLWIQGIATKCMQRFDEDRYQGELQVYLAMLNSYEQEGATVSAIQFSDL